MTRARAGTRPRTNGIVVTRGDDFAEVKVDPKNPDIVFTAQHRVVEVHRRRQDVQGRCAARPAATTTTASGSIPNNPDIMLHRRRPGRDHHGQRRRDVEQLVQPADGAVLSRQHRQRVPVPRLRRPAGERLRVRRRAAATTGGSRSATGIRSASRSTATSPPIRSIPTSSTAARSRATTGGPAK